MLYFDLEPLRQEVSSALLDAIRQGETRGFEFTDWCRIVDWRYALAPLSIAGSITAEGGRFNIGATLSPGTFTAFPALYFAANYDTALQEKFGTRLPKSPKSLSSLDLAVRSLTSFTQCRLRGQLERFIDVSDHEALKPFVNVLREFALPKPVLTLSRQLGFQKLPWLIRSAAKLQEQLLHPHWKTLPMQFDLPSNSQIFGRIACAAGVHGIRYPSARHAGKHCLDLFPQNWRGSASFVEVMDPPPPGVAAVRWDGNSNESA